MRSARAEGKSLHTWIIVVFVKQHLVQIGRIDGPTDYLPQLLTAVKPVERFSHRLAMETMTGTLNVGNLVPALSTPHLAFITAEYTGIHRNLLNNPGVDSLIEKEVRSQTFWR